jgi:hypothetical protein
MIAHWNIEYAHVVPLTMGKWLMFLNSCWFLRKSSSSHLQINPAFQRFIFRWIYHQNIQFFLRSSPKLGQVVGIVGLGDIGLRIRERSRGSWQSQWGWDPYKWMLCIYIYIHVYVYINIYLIIYIYIYIYYEYIYMIMYSWRFVGYRCQNNVIAWLDLTSIFFDVRGLVNQGIISK